MAGNIRTIKTSDFEALKKEKGIFLIDFWAEWCGPCKVMNPILEQLSSDEDLKKVSFLKINIDQEPELAGMFRVTSIPTFYVLNLKGDGTFDLEKDVAGKMIGAKPAFDFKMELQETINKI